MGQTSGSGGGEPVVTKTSQEERYVAKVTMPQLGESVAEGTIGKWLKQPGDSVARDEPLLEVITDKVNAEVPSPFEGVLRKILVEEGKTVPYNAEIAEIEEVAGAAAAPRGAGTPAAKAAAPGTFAVATTAAAAKAAAPGTVAGATTAAAATAAAPGTSAGATTAAPLPRRRRRRRRATPRIPSRSRSRASDAGRGRRPDRRPERANDPGRAAHAARARPDVRPRSSGRATPAGSPATT